MHERARGSEGMPLPSTEQLYNSKAMRREGLDHQYTQKWKNGHYLWNGHINKYFNKMKGQQCPR